MRYGHASPVALRCYVNNRVEVPDGARTLEAAMGIEDLVRAVLEAVADPASGTRCRDRA
jgi:hypothetical protein